MTRRTDSVTFTHHFVDPNKMVSRPTVHHFRSVTQMVIKLDLAS
jgi:hypothetical protein